MRSTLLARGMRSSRSRCEATRFATSSQVPGLQVTSRGRPTLYGGSTKLRIGDQRFPGIVRSRIYSPGRSARIWGWRRRPDTRREHPAGGRNRILESDRASSRRPCRDSGTHPPPRSRRHLPPLGVAGDEAHVLLDGHADPAAEALLVALDLAHRLVEVDLLDPEEG